MPIIPITMPQLGESIAEATVVSIAVKVGDHVKADQDVMEVETNKAVMAVASPCPGVVKELLVEVQQSYTVGAVLGYLDVTVEDAKRLGLDEPVPSSPMENGAAELSQSFPAATPARKGVQPTVGGLPVPASAAGASYMSPRMKARMHELGLHAADLSGVAGSGAAGRVTIEDFEKFLSHLEKQKTTPASSMRVAVADSMRRSWTRPLATVALPGEYRPAPRAPQSFQPEGGARALRPARAGDCAR